MAAQIIGQACAGADSVIEQHVAVPVHIHIRVSCAIDVTILLPAILSIAACNRGSRKHYKTEHHDFTHIFSLSEYINHDRPADDWLQANEKLM
jgi:hypothetical protein